MFVFLLSFFGLSLSLTSADALASYQQQPRGGGQLCRHKAPGWCIHTLNLEKKKHNSPL